MVKVGRTQKTGRSYWPRVAKYSMALPGHAPGIDAQMPALRGGLRRLLHRRRRFRLNRPMDPNSNAGVLSDVAGISCDPILAQARQVARMCGVFRIMIACGAGQSKIRGPFFPMVNCVP